jgi:hypothetical protein
MKLWTRRLILFIALSLFFVIAPMIVFYAMGYRYDFKNKAFRKIGMIIVESVPQNVDLFLNNQFKSNKTPFKIKNLPPGEYSIKVTKKDYSSWEKKLFVESKMVTWASNVKLFYQSPKITSLLSLPEGNFSISLDYEKLVLNQSDQKNFGLVIFDLKSEKIEKIFPKSKDSLNKFNSKNNVLFSNFLWSHDGRKIIFSWQEEGKRKYAMVDARDPDKVIFINDLFNLEIENVKWDKESNEKVYLINNKNLYRLDLNSKTLSESLANQVIDYTLGSNEIIYLANKTGEDGILLNKINKNKKEEKETIMRLPKNENLEMKLGAENNLALLLAKKEKLYLINLKNNKSELLGEKIKNFAWSRNGDKLLYFGENEVWFNVLKDRAESVHPEYKFNYPNLLTRYSVRIKNVFWYPDEEHIVLLLDNSIKIVELDERDKRNFYEFSKDLKVKNYNLEFDKDGESIYLIDEKSKNLYKITITEI